MRKTVFDTNIWISYFIKGNTVAILDFVENHKVKFMRSVALHSELIDVLNRPKFKKYFPNGTAEYMIFFEGIAERFDTVAVFKECADAKDNYLFDLAYQSNCNYLVSGDKKVLETLVRKSLHLVTLSKFKEEILQ